VTFGYCSGCALLVQLVERRSPKPDVGGSSPPGRVHQRLSPPGNRVETHCSFHQPTLGDCKKFVRGEVNNVVKKGSTTPEVATAKESKGEVASSNFVEATKDELAKVVWPSRQQLISESVAVVLMVILVATVIYFVDNLFHWGSGKVFG
jgi:preprotein translocase subunit SecE